MQDETMVVLAEYNTITEAEIAKSMLDSAGIWSMIRNEYMSAIYPIGTMPAQGRRPRGGRRESQSDAAAQIERQELPEVPEALVLSSGRSARQRDGLTLPPAGFVSARRFGSVIRPSPEN